MRVLTKVCPKCEGDLTGGIVDGGLDLTKSSCHNCGFHVVVQPAPVVEQPVETASEAAPTPATAKAPKAIAPKAPVAKKAPAKKAALKPVVAKPAPSVKLAIDNKTKTVSAPSAKSQTGTGDL